MRTATAMTAASILVIKKKKMTHLLRDNHALSTRFIASMLARNIRAEELLIEHFFNSTEKRLARKLLDLASFGEEDQPQQILPKVSVKTLSQMIGISSAKAAHFMNKFKKLGFVDYNGTLRVNSSLLNIVLHD